MKAKIWIGVSVVALAVVINSCENKSVPLPSSALGNCDTVNLTYSSGTNTMKSIIDLQCATNNTACHSTGSVSRYDYNSYSVIYSNYSNGLLYSCLFQNAPFHMPQTAQPGWNDSSACMLAKFKAWMDQGCKQ